MVKHLKATCIITNCRNLAPSSEPFCSVHRDRNELTMKNADARRRIHIWPGERAAWSFGPTSTKFKAEAGTIGAAVEEALAQIGHEPAVIIYEGKAA